jgi:hypothetical protein
MHKNMPVPTSGRILFMSAMFVIVSASFATLMRYGFCYSAPKVVVDNKPKVGVVNGVVYSAGNPCAVVDGAMVREGDVIGDIAVVGIQHNAVAFSKAGVTWQQEVHEMPHKAWTEPAPAFGEVPPKVEKVAVCDGK